MNRNKLHHALAVAVFGIDPFSTLSGVFCAALFVTFYNLTVVVDGTEWGVEAAGPPIYVLALFGWLIGRNIGASKVNKLNVKRFPKENSPRVPARSSYNRMLWMTGSG